jgi:hypothetical protein
MVVRRARPDVQPRVRNIRGDDALSTDRRTIAETLCLRADDGRMLDPVALEWRDDVILTCDLVVPADRAEFFRRVRHREFLPIFRGVFVRAEHWSSLSNQDRYRARVMAAAAFVVRVGSLASVDTTAAFATSAAGRPLFANHSAAALWRLAWIGAWPQKVHTAEPLAAGGRSNAMFIRHTGGLPDDWVEIDGLDVTTLARTVVDLARTESFGRAVTLADSALRRTLHPIEGLPRTILTMAGLEAELDRVPVRHGSAKARRVIEFADGAADRPGESMSRVSMQVAGLPRPQLQVKLAGASGRIWTVDFWWPSANLIGEFDGQYKYTEPEFLRGRTPQQVVYDEKLREDDLRAAGHLVCRWPWKIALSPALLRDRLVAAGLR